jgi:NAD(P)-dependent dehydrogenase (short-subunit alcohol dehydrogenase family)
MPSYAITGAGRGMGLEYVRQLTSDPSNIVFALVRTPEKATKLQELATERPNIHILKADVTDFKSLSEAAEATSKVTGGKLDVLIHNAVNIDEASAGLVPSQLPSDAEGMQAIFKDAINTAIFATVWVTNAYLPLIEAGEQKKIIHISTGLVDLDLINGTGIAFAIPYSVGKAGMNIVSAKYGAELEPKGIKVLALSPGYVDTYEGPCKFLPRRGRC